MKNATILVVEDEKSLAVGLTYNLEEEGYRTLLAEDGREALRLFKEEPVDLIILDLMIPYIDGIEVARRIRAESERLPILILTARAGLNDKVEGLEIGADDYLTKPFHLKELLLRVKRMLERSSWTGGVEAEIDEYSFGSNTVDFRTLTAQTQNGEIQLTRLEAEVMRYLIRNKGRIVSQKELLESVWDVDSAMRTRTVDNFVLRLRKHFEPDHNFPVYIRSVRGAGYMFQPDG